MSNLREYRKAAGLSQTELAERAGVSRQLVGAAEVGRNLPRVDAAMALADALGVGVEQLFSQDHRAVDVLTGEPPPDGAMVRTSFVGSRLVTSPLGSGGSGWDAADAIVAAGSIDSLQDLSQGLVVAGCEPGLQVLERMLREAGTSAFSVLASSAAAIDALTNGRVHAAVVHGPAVKRDTSDLEVERFRLTTWQVGLAAPPGTKSGWFADASEGRVPVVQREAGAGVQKSFEDMAGHDVPGPMASGHVEAVQRSMFSGIPALTIEPAALAVGAVFEPIDTHEVEIWIGRAWVGERFASDALGTILSRRFQARLTAVGGYDLTSCGQRVGA